MNRRRIIVAGMMCAMAGPVMFNSAPAVAGKSTTTRVHPAVRYMKKVASTLLLAQRTGTNAAFRNAIFRHADVAQISLYSLGRYKSQLKRSVRSRYFRGVNAFMARYLADQARKYIVVKTQISSKVSRDGNEVLVSSRVKIASGSNYTVVWRLAPRRKSWRITDVKVLGFSLTYLQRGIFSRYIAKKGGDVMALVTALDR